jgi:hypothetical protein
MVDPSRTVFLSYRREVSWALAQAVRGELLQHGFDVFMDVHGIDSGEFAGVILREIEARTHFLVLVEPRSLDRIGDDADWLRRELAHALSHGRNVVPLLANGAVLPLAADLPANVARLSAYNAVSVPHDYFAEAMSKLRDRFLRPPAVDMRPENLATTPVITASQKVFAVALSWTVVEGARLYELQYQISAGTVEIYRGTATTFKHWAVRSSTAGLYRVRAELADGRSGPWSPLTRPR